jgi:hypothetical protein
MAQTASASAQVITVPPIKVYGAGDSHRLMPFSFEGQIGAEITDFGKPYEDLHKGSIALKDQATLFQLYLLSELGEAPELPEDVRNVVYKLFDKIGFGNVTDDACDYNNGARLRKAKPTDRSVRWIIRPERFELTEDGWSAIIGEDSDVRHILIPEPGYAELTCDGAYRPDTGTPFSTAKTRKAAEQSWIERGFSPEFAEKAVSYLHSREEGKGTAAVVRWCSSADGGRFSVVADWEPGDWDRAAGSFAASRSAERSEAAPDDRGIKVLTLDEYSNLEAAAKQLEDVRNVLKC